MKLPCKFAVVGATALTVSTPFLSGAGYQLAERSASGLGRAYSGEAAIGDDASILASNPAGMILLDDTAISAGLQYIAPDIDVSGIGVTGPISDKGVISEAVVPYFYASKRLNEDLVVGVGNFTPFGLATNYALDFATGAGTDVSELLTLNIAPSIAYRINENLTIGAGFDALYADGQITAVTPGVGSNLFYLEGDDWAYSFNLGVLLELNEGTRFGLHYRHSYDLELKGSAILGASLGGPATVPATLDVELPAIIEFSAYHELNEQWAVHGDVMWTEWKSFQTLAPMTGTPADPSLAVDESWDDTFRYAIGTTYTHDEKWTFRAGLAFDESPVAENKRTLRIPDGDRIWASIGARYRINPCYTLDVGYTHIFADAVTLSNKALGGNEDFLTRAKGSGDVNILAIGVNGSF